MIILYVLIAILILLLMITVHELGHYITGKLLKFKIKEFSIGFGPALFKRKNKKNGEVFSVRAFPLGGYCAFEGEDEAPKTDAEGKKIETEGEFNRQKPWKRLLVLAGGAFFNIVFGIIMCAVMLWSVGFDIPQVVHVRADSANYAVLREGDVIYKVNNDRISVLTGNNLQTLINKYSFGETVNLEIKRDGKIEVVQVTIEILEYKNSDGQAKETNDIGLIKLDTNLEINATGLDAYRHGFFEGMGRSFEVGVGISWEVLSSLGKLIVGKLDIDQMSGPIDTVSQIAKLSMLDAGLIMVFIPLISINLGVFNLLPVPALDGGRMVFVIIEWIRKKPIKREVEAMIHFVGLIILFGGVLLLDLLKLF